MCLFDATRQRPEESPASGPAAAGTATPVFLREFSLGEKEKQGVRRRVRVAPRAEGGRQKSTAKIGRQRQKREHRGVGGWERCQTEQDDRSGGGGDSAESKIMRSSAKTFPQHLYPFVRWR